MTAFISLVAVAQPYRSQVQTCFGFRWATEASFDTLDEAEDMATALWDGGSGWDAKRLRVLDGETLEVVRGNGA
jgi:hypothetical protein